MHTGFAVRSNLPYHALTKHSVFRSSPRNADFVQDAIFVEALLTSPATIAMDIGTNNHREFVAPAGATSGWLPFPSTDNEIPFIQIIRNGQVVKAVHGSKFITHSCDVYNFNPWVGVL